MCANPHCQRTLKADGPSLYYCSVVCAAANTELMNRQRYMDRLAYGAHLPDLDPCSWDTRCAHPKVHEADVSEAFSWLDVRAAQ
jgi:hypothetical protein